MGSKVEKSSIKMKIYAFRSYFKRFQGYKKSYGKAAYKNKLPETSYLTDIKDFMWLLMQNLDVLMSALMLVLGSVPNLKLIRSPGEIYKTDKFWNSELVFYIFVRRKFTNWKPGKKS